VAAFDKRRLRREIERERRARVKARLAELRQQIKEARAKRQERLGIIRDQCRAERKALTVSCATRRLEARQAASDAVLQRRKAIGDVHGEERIIREADSRVRKMRGSSSRDRRAESDDEVRGNLPPELVPVFDSVRRGIKGTVRKSRTESFLQWAEENPGDVLAMQSDRADREVEQLIAELEREQRAEGRRRRRAAVPF
jgi:hypothetical protein